MADRFDTRYVIGGVVPSAQVLEELTALLAEIELVDSGYPDKDEIDACIEDGKPIDFYFEGIIGGQIDDLEELCQKHGLTYWRNVEPKYQFQGEVAFWEPGMEQPRCEDSDDDGDIQVSLTELEQMYAAGKGLKDVIDVHKMKGGDDVPPLSVAKAVLQ